MLYQPPKHLGLTYYVFAYKSKHSSGYFGSKYHQQTGEKLLRENTDFTHLIPFYLLSLLASPSAVKALGKAMSLVVGTLLGTLPPPCSWQGPFVWLNCYSIQQLAT